MKVIINGEVEENKNILDSNNRSFQFGDGVFETILVHKDEIRYCQTHYKRLTDALSVIKLDSTRMSFELFESSIIKAVEANNLESARVKFMVYRKPSDIPGYKTDSYDFDFVVIVKPMTSTEVIILKNTGLSHTITLHQSIYSAYKTMNSLDYILAEIEKKERELDEMILLDTNKNVSECVSSNIFWINKDEIFTSPLSTGCKNGVMRQQIMNYISVQEKLITYNEIKNAHTIFTTNVAGLGIFDSIDDRKLSTNHPILEKIKPLWAL